ncbi:MAG: hypothetical protein OEM02_00190 [Desulfobulbaceae bacterium]|nr:hypothetical protein [Desulfobulbaceae bacterium]
MSKKKPSDETGSKTGKRVTFAPNDQVEKLRPFVDEFWSLILRTSYDTSFVSNESTLDSWQSYVSGGKDALIERVKWYYGVDIISYYDQPIPNVLAKVREGNKGKKQYFKKLPAAIKSGDGVLGLADKQHIVRAYGIPMWPDYKETSLETILLYIFDIVVILIGIVFGKVFSIPGGYVLIGIFVFIGMCFQSVKLFFWLKNMPIRSDWERRVGEVISLKRVAQITEPNRNQWIMIGVPKTPPYYSFGTYANFGGGWDSLVLLNTHSSEHFVVRGSLRKAHNSAKRINLAIWD